MTPFRWVLLCIFFTLYLLFGGSIFMLIEQHHEIHQKEELHVLRQDIQEILFRLDHNFYNNMTSPDVLEALTSAKEGVINRISAACGLDNLLEDTEPPEPTSLKWNYYNSVFFAFTVVTTIGYGHLSPSTSLSKALMMVYALFGIPLNGILLSGVGDYFSNKLVKVHQKSKDKQYRGKSLTLVFEIIFYLIPGIVVFIIIPAGIFVLIENWTFLDSVYFAFVSLTTIGFGDYVAGMGDGHNIWLWLYKAFIIIWITFGLGYLIMILGFIAKGMKSKKVRGVLEKRLTGIRNTKEKLSKDIDYMRRIVNELYLMKIKPVYDVQAQGQEDSKIMHGTILGARNRRPSCVHFERKCSSLPGLPIYVDGEPQLPGGRPYYSHNELGGQRAIRRRLSESDLSRVNLTETFANAKDSVTHDELLATVVSALSGNVIQNVMDAVDELNKYEQQVENEKKYGTIESPDDSFEGDQRRGSTDSESGASTTIDNLTPTDNYPVAQPWELGALSESDEEELLDDNSVKTQQLESVVVDKPGGTEGDVNEGHNLSFLDKVSGAIRKISANMTPPETPSRKISRNESDKKRKISRADSEKFAANGTMRNPHGISQYSPFIRRHSTRRQQLDVDPKLYTKNLKRKPSGDLRKISQESRISNNSVSSYHTIDEILTSARASRKNTPVPYHPSSPLPPLEGDHIDASTSSEYGRSSLEASTSSSLANFLRALDDVQDRLHKTSVCSDASYSGSYMSSRTDAMDLGNNFVYGSATRPIPNRYKRPSSIGVPFSPESVDRKRKVGIFQPGFSYVNFGYNPDEEDDGSVQSVVMARKAKQLQKKDDDVSKNSSGNNNNNLSSGNPLNMSNKR